MRADGHGLLFLRSAYSSWWDVGDRVFFGVPVTRIGLQTDPSPSFMEIL